MRRSLGHGSPCRSRHDRATRVWDIDELRLRELIRGDRLDANGFDAWLAQVPQRSVRLHHPAQIAHQVSNPDVPAAIADLVQGAINQPMSIYEMGPAAQAVEGVVIEWMTEKVGWPEGAGGVLTHGDSPGEPDGGASTGSGSTLTRHTARGRCCRPSTGAS